MTIETIDSLLHASYLSERKIKSVNKSSLSPEKATKWIDGTGLDKDAFADYLKSKGISLEQFTEVVDGSTPSVSETPLWVTQLKHIFLFENQGNFDEEHGFGNFVIPFIMYFRKAFTKNLKKNDTKVLDIEEVTKSLVMGLYQVLRQAADKTVILDFQQQKDNKVSTESFYNTYISRLNNDYIYSVLLNFPVLARYLTETTIRYIDNTLEIVEAFIQDYEEISEYISDEDSPRLYKILVGLGDPHKGGKSVSMLEFTSHQRIMYKPRSLAIDNAYGQFLEWINARGLVHKVQTVRSIDKGTHGWQSFIENKPCESVDDIKTYYYRMGVLIGITHLLDTTDIHYENIIASSAHPYIIDLETTLSNFTQDFKSMRDDPFVTIKESVLGSGLLPSGNVFNSKVDFDTSGLTALPQQKSSSMRGWALVEDNSGEARFEDVGFVTSEENHLVRYNNEIVRPISYKDNITNGFNDIYKLFLTHKSELSSVVNKLFAKCECRIVLRPTYVYSRFWLAGLHPKYLQSGLDKERLFNMMFNIVGTNPEYFRIASSEIDQLLDDDIPYFTFYPDSTSIFDGNNKEISNVFHITSLEKIEETIDTLSESDLSFQLNVLNLSIESNHIEPYHVNDVEKMSMSQKVNIDFSHGEMNPHSLAIDLGEYFVSHAIISEQYKTWLSLERDRIENKYKLQLMDFTLYNGVLGVALFLSQLARATSKQVYEDYAKGAVELLINKVKQIKEVYTSSAFSGIGSIVYALTYLGNLWGDKDLLVQADSYLDELLPINDNNNEYDFLGGHAGVITMCVNIYNTNSNTKARNVAIVYGDDLLEYLEQMVDSLGENKLLTGLSHGASGYIYALVKLQEVMDDNRIHYLINRLLTYEDSHFSSESKNWLDLRETTSHRSGQYYWCHGSPGISLVRVKLGENVVNDGTSIQKVVTHFSGIENDRLGICHGLFGNLDILLEIAKTNETVISKRQTLSLANQHLNKNDIMNKITGMKDRGLIGYKLGISGVGYTLLRLLDNTLPAIFALELPESMMDK